MPVLQVRKDLYPGQDNTSQLPKLPQRLQRSILELNSLSTGITFLYFEHGQE